MRAVLDDAACIHHHDPVHGGDRGQAVRDGDDGLALHHLRQRVLDRGLDLAVQRRCRLVQHQHRRILQERAGQGNALALSTREFHAAFAKMGVIAAPPGMVAKVQDELMRLGAAGGVDHLVLTRPRTAIKDVVTRRAVEHRGFLRDHRDLAAQAFLRQVAHIRLVQHHAPALGVVEPEQQRHEGGLARARRPDDAQFLTRFHVQRQIDNATRIAAIGEAYLIEADASLGPLDLQRAVTVGQGMGR